MSFDVHVYIHFTLIGTDAKFRPSYVLSTDTNVVVLTLSHLNKVRFYLCIPELIWQILLYY